MTFKIIGQINTKGGINSISLGFHPNTLILGQTGGNISFIKINADRDQVESKRNSQVSSQSKPSCLQKIHEVKLLDANISKVIRTTRNDIAFGTSKGVYFYKVNQDYSLEPALNMALL